MPLPAPARVRVRVLDGNTVTAKIAHALSDAFFVYPITPSTPASEHVERLVTRGKPNIHAVVPKFEYMYSELGSIAACHGASHAQGVMATTFTSSQGLLLMLPSIIKMVGERRPAVIHVASRALAGSTLNIYGDHADVMQLRSTGAVIISSANQEECQYNAILSYLAARLLRVPVIHFYDGFDTSHELYTVQVLNRYYLQHIWRGFCQLHRLEDNKSSFYTPTGAIGLVSNDDTNFQLQLALKHDIGKFNVAIRQLYQYLNGQFGKLGLAAGRQPIEIVAHSGAARRVKHVIVAMGSSTDILRRSIEQGSTRAALLRVNVFRPLDANLLTEIMRTFPYAGELTVLDRNLELQAPQVLYSDIVSAMTSSGVNMSQFTLKSGVYGIGGRELRPEDADEVVRGRSGSFFTVNVNDDVGRTSLHPQGAVEPGGYTYIKIYGIGSEGFVTAAERLARAVGERAQVQKASHYDAKKAGGVTESDVRICTGQRHGVIPLHHRIRGADGVLVSQRDILNARGEILGQINKNGVLLLLDEPVLRLSDGQLKMLRDKAVAVYSLDTIAMRRDLGMDEKGKTNFYAVQALADLLNLGVTVAGEGITKYVTKTRLEGAQDARPSARYFERYDTDRADHIRGMIAVGRGGEIPVSAFQAFAKDPIMEHNTARLNPLPVSDTVAKFAGPKCVECGRCAAVCPHGVIQPILLTEAEADGLRNKVGGAALHKVGYYRYYLNINERGCTGCGVCVAECPTQALSLGPSAHDTVLTDYLNGVMAYGNYAQRLPRTLYSQKTMQFLGQFSYCHSACAGCGESGYINLLGKALHGARLEIVQGTGCPLVYLGQYGSYPLAAHTFWTNSLFEDTNEVAFGLQTILDRPVWAVLGDGAAMDINFSGLDFNIQSGRPVKILVLDTHGYSNTGGQRSSASPPGTVMRLATAGVKRRPKDLVQLMMTYRHAYIATITLNDPQRAARVLRTAHEFPGAALVIAYSPCISHKPTDKLNGVKMMRHATQAGIFPLLSYDPRRPRGARLVLENEKGTGVAALNEGRVQDATQLYAWASDRWEELRALSAVI